MMTDPQPASPEPIPVELGAAQKNWRLKKISADILGLLSSIDWLTWVVLVCLIVFGIQLGRLPLQFSSQEAATQVYTRELLQENFLDTEENLLPTFWGMQTAFDYGSTVYLQILPYISFGSSVLTARGFSVFASLVCIWLLDNLLKEFFGQKMGWLVGLILANSAAWFLLSRSAIPAMTLLAAYAAYWVLYLHYRFRSTKYAFGVVLVGAILFYGNLSGQILSISTVLILLVIDWRYHWANRKIFLSAFGLTLLCCLPWVRFLFQHPQAYTNLLQNNPPQWISDQGVFLLGKLLLNYLAAFDPGFWFLPNSIFTGQPAQWLLGPLGYLSVLLMPFLLYGMSHLVKERKNLPATRYLWILLLLAPTATLWQGNQLPSAAYVILPLALFTTIGWERWLNQFARRNLRFQRWKAQFSFSLFGLGAVGLLGIGLLGMPAWTKDYGLNGIQYGAEQVYTAVKEIKTQHSRAKISISSGWIDQPDLLRRFFLPYMQNIQYDQLATFMENSRPELSEFYFLLRNDQLAHIVDSGKFLPVEIINTIRSPKGQPMFHLVYLTYRLEIKQILQEENENRHKLVEDSANWQSQTLQIEHSRLDSGSVANLFDADLNTLVRTNKVNPLVLEIRFSQPVQMNAVQMRVGSEALQAEAQVFLADRDEPLVFSQFASRTNGNKDMQIDFDQTYTLQTLTLSLKDSEALDTAFVHLWEIVFIIP
jgi:4-amino-4-deoxy-L-arabinose transferase-like glycosyltransferase